MRECDQLVVFLCHPCAFGHVKITHGRVPAAVLRPNSMQGRLMRVKVPHAPWASQCDLRDPGCDVWLVCVAFCKIFNSLA